MLSRTPITQRDVANACGVHPSTICLALRNSPSIPEETRRRVQLAAQELGYQPNAAARNLALLRTEKKKSGNLPLAWINQEDRRDHWRTDEQARLLFEAAGRRAAEVGYHLEEIWTREPGMNAARVTQIVRARGIEGVIFPIHRRFDRSLFAPAWEGFSMVGVNDHRLAEWIDVVAPDHLRNAETILRRLDQLGLARVGLASNVRFEAMSCGLVHASFERRQTELPPMKRIPTFMASGESRAVVEFSSWVRKYEPAAVVCGDATLIHQARSAGINPVWIGLEGSAFPFDGGIDEASGDVAAAAVDCVVEKMRRFEKGPREATCMHLRKQAWIEPRIVAVEIEPAVA
jgi:DNA-binding LacI/PurR family transcriptional regulator